MSAIGDLITKALEAGDDTGVVAATEWAQVSMQLLYLLHVLSCIDRDAVEAAKEAVAACQELEVSSQNVH